MHASTSASLTSSILSRDMAMYSPRAAACAVATISISGATGIVMETSRDAALVSPGGAVPPCDIGCAPRLLEPEEELQRADQYGRKSIGGRRSADEGDLRRVYD